MNNEFVERIVQTVSMSLNGVDEIPSELIEERVRKSGEFFGLNITEEETKLAIKKLEANFAIHMDCGATITNSKPIPWVRNRSENIDWYYWNRYKQHLTKNNFGNRVIGSMDIVTDEILDLLQNPIEGGKWQKKGLIVGHVQSGKTANYAGVINKALDAGYRVVIILAGLLNSLRGQTQDRIDSGVIGVDSSLTLQDIPLLEQLVGVGKFDHDCRPVSLTTIDSDFNKNVATQVKTAIGQFNDPIIFVVKKNVTILNNLTDWLKTNNFDLSKEPMLLIDDEADHASINTKKDDLDPTKTNQGIRNLLELFPKNVYLGYTATPFANIFINPETPEEMFNDLFPEDFIKTLDAPSNYLGSERIFIENDLNLLRNINDYNDFLPFEHKKEELPVELPESLKEAIRVYIIGRTIRILRNQGDMHSSMLVNVSRFTAIQSEVRLLIHSYVTELREAISNYYALSLEDALKSPGFKQIYMTWKKEFSNTEPNWATIQKFIKKAISTIDIIEVNASKNAEKVINYSKRDYPHGRHVIAVGGLSLSRGITLEGLSVSYFLRNSIMYDTLMQMGRWFGYRNGYEDLCRIYMTEVAQGWYEYIADATKELRSEFEKMSELGKTPRDFGLCVRNHPKSLIVTARNKMRYSKTIIREIDLTGRLVETTRLFSGKDKVKINLNLADDLIRNLRMFKAPEKLKQTNHLFWQGIPYKFISDYVGSFKNHPESGATDSDAIKKYIDILSSKEGIEEWNVLFVSLKKPDKDLNITPEHEELKNIIPEIRKKTRPCRAGIMLGQRKLASEGLDKIDLEKNQKREVPLLMLHYLDCRDAENQDEPLFPHGIVGYGISFPGEKNGRRIKTLASYQVNTTWMNQEYGDEIENDEDLGEDINE